MRVNYLSLLIGFGVFAGAMLVLGQTSAGDEPADASTRTADNTTPA
jgi:hypothetical protein